MRGVLRRAQGPHHRAVRPPVRVREVCGAADQDENPDVSRVPRAHPGDHEGVLHLSGLLLDENLRQVHLDEAFAVVPVRSCAVDDKEGWTQQVWWRGSMLQAESH